MKIEDEKEIVRLWRSEISGKGRGKYEKVRLFFSLVLEGSRPKRSGKVKRFLIIKIIMLFNVLPNILDTYLA